MVQSLYFSLCNNLRNVKRRFFIALLIFNAVGVSAFSQRNNAILETEWGEFGDQPGQFKFPAMIATDRYSNVYVADQHNHRIQKFDSLGNFILMWGSYGNEPGQFNYPYGIAIDSEDNVFVSDMNNNRIQKFTSGGQFISSIGQYGSGNGEFKYPYGVAVDGRDLLYVIDAFNYRIQVFDKDLRFVSKWGSQEDIGIKLYMPHEIAVTAAGEIILSDRQNHRVSVFSQSGALIKRIGNFGEGSEAKGDQFSEPHDIVADKAGNIYVSDRYNFCIHKFDHNWNFRSKWFTTAIKDNSRYFPLGLAAGKNGTVYVTDHYAHRVLMYHVMNDN